MQGQKHRLVRGRWVTLVMCSEGLINVKGSPPVGYSLFQTIIHSMIPIAPVLLVESRTSLCHILCIVTILKEQKWISARLD